MTELFADLLIFGGAMMIVAGVALAPRHMESKVVLGTEPHTHVLLTDLNGHVFKVTPVPDGQGGLSLKTEKLP